MKKEQANQAQENLEAPWERRQDLIFRRKSVDLCFTFAMLMLTIFCIFKDNY